MSSAKSEFIMLLETIEKDKGIPRQEILRLIEGALASALHKHLGQEGLPVKTEIDAETGEMNAFIVKRVTETAQDPIREIVLAEAKTINPQIELGADLGVKVDTSEFSRIAAQTAKQVILQKLREVENENLFKDFKKKESLIITGSVYRVAADKTVYVSLGKIEAMLKKEDQIPGVRFAIGQVLKALVKAVEPALKAPKVYLSQTDPNFVKGLLRLEVPEVHDGTIEVVKVAREAGFRSKVLVKSSDPKVDPVGSCVGIKGTRIKPIINELYGEKIDLVAASDKIEDFVSLSLAPAKIEKVEIEEDQEKKIAIVYVSEDQVAGTIGKDGLNLKLASELTGFNISVNTIAHLPKPAVVVAKKEEDLPSEQKVTDAS